MELSSISADLIRGKVETMILKCLLKRDLYGLEIASFIQNASGGSYTLKQPTMYSALKRLERRGLIAGYDVDSNIGGRRRYYRLTQVGHESLGMQEENWTYSKNVIDTLFFGAPTRSSLFIEEGIREIKNHNIKIPEFKTAFDLPLGGEIQEIVSIKPFFLADKVEPILEPVFEKYISPNERVTLPNKPVIFIENIKNLDFEQPVSVSKEQLIIPFVRHFGKPCNTFVLYNRLRAAASIITGVLMVIGLFILFQAMRGIYQPNQDVVFVLAYVGIGIYIALNLATFAVIPKLRKMTCNYRRELWVRGLITFGLLIAIMGSNFVAGAFIDGNIRDYLVFFIAPAILAMGVFVEGVGMCLLKNNELFRG